ncbi:hypothetical protein E3N88_11583 [Mikania micrantha]|uniref:Tubby C-terminal domain-containing protein n=1 Tax=Mikania micrantha TaxID=192012 RepID=A0A5N6PFS5_9ASTR|nr:hypothetical protein E3N88_11583 [Mikania micrantha]
MANPMAVVGPNFLAPRPVDLIIDKKLWNGNFTITDVNGNVVFKVKEKFMSLRERRVLFDAAGNPILSFQKKVMSFLESWQAFKGDSKDSKDKLFSVKRSSLFQIRVSLNVFLASNAQNPYDFKVKGSWFGGSCTIYARDGTTIIAKMEKKHTVGSVLFGKDKFKVTVHPNVDYAFIVALILILSTAGSNNSGGQSGG